MPFKFFLSCLVTTFLCSIPLSTQAGLASRIRKSSANPIKFVQASTMARTANASTSSTSFSAAPAVGNTVVISFWGWYTTSFGFSFPASTVSDNHGNTYSPAVTYITNNGTYSYFLAIYYTNVVTTGSPFTVTAAPTGAADMVAGSVEYSGVLAASPVDRLQTASATSANATTGLTLQTSKGNELIVAVLNLGVYSSPCVITPQVSSFKVRFTELDGLNYEAGQMLDNLVSTTGVYSHDWTVTSGIWQAAIVTFRAR